MKKSKKNYIFISGFLFAFLMLTPGISYATTYYVAKTGNDLNPGTEVSPFLNIKRGLSNLSAGDTLYVKTGAYNESFLSWETTIPSGKSWNEPIVIAAYPGHTVTINPPSGHAFFWVKDGQAKYLIIDGFIIDGQKKAHHGFKFSDNTRYIRIQNSEIKNTTSSGILLTACGGCSDPTKVPVNTYHQFINLNVHHNGLTKYHHGFYIATSHNLVEGSEIHHNLGYGIQVFRATYNDANNNIIRKNTIHDNNESGEWGCGLVLGSGKDNIAHTNLAYGNVNGFCITYRSTDTQLYNNVSFENDISGIRIGKGSNGAQVSHNTIYQNGSHGIEITDGAQRSFVRNNIAYKNGSKEIFLNPGGHIDTTISHNFTSEPAFVNAQAKDFHLRESSLAIDGGMLISDIPIDYDGMDRIQGTNPDIGAYENPQSKDDTSPPKVPVILKISAVQSSQNPA